MGVDFFETDEVHVLNTASSRINPSTEEKQDLIKTALDNIYTAVDGLELSLDTLNLTADSINLDVDEVEAKLESIKTKLDTLNSTDFSTATNQALVIGELQDIEADVEALHSSFTGTDFATQTTVATLLTEATFVAEDFASNTTLEAARVLLNSLDTKFDVALSTRASESTVATLLTEATFTAEDFATQTTLEAARVLLASMDTKFDVNLSTRASESTLAAAKVVLDNILAAVDDLEGNTDEIEAKLESIKTKLDTVNATDFATEATQSTLLTEAEFEARTGEVTASPSANTILGRLKAINDNVSAINLDTDGIAKETTLSSVLSKLTELDNAFDAEDFASQTTLAAFKAEAKSESDATQAILATLLTEATFSAEDFATQGTLEAARVLISSLNTKFDVNLSTRASEATVATLLTEATFTAEDFASQTTLEAVRVLLVSLDNKDFATNTTLSAFMAQQTVDLQSIEDAVDELKAEFTAEDFASETTLLAFKAEAKSESDATQVRIDTTNTHLGNIVPDVDNLRIAVEAGRDAFERLTNGKFNAAAGEFNPLDFVTDVLGNLTTIYSGLAVNGDDAAVTNIPIMKVTFDANGNPTSRTYGTSPWNDRTTATYHGFI